MSKVLLSFLGKGTVVLQEDGTYKRKHYQPVEYFFSDKPQLELKKTQYLIGALIEGLQPDKVILFGTASSSWYDLYSYFLGDDKYSDDLLFKQLDSDYKRSVVTEDDLGQFKKALSEKFSTQIGKKITIIPQLLTYGISENEIITNFKKFIELKKFISSQSEIFIDITHGFRSLPLMAYSFMDYLQSLLKWDIQVEGIFYGVYELISEKNNRGEDLRIPIINLKKIWEITDWTKGVNELVKYQNGYSLSAILDDEFDALKKCLNNYSNTLNFLAVDNFRDSLRKLDERINKDSAEMFPGSLVLAELDKKITNLLENSTEAEFQFAMAEEFYQAKQFSNALILTNEAIITGLCEMFGCDYRKRFYRDAMKKVRIIIPEQGYPGDFKKRWTQFNDLRNNTAHGSLGGINYNAHIASMGRDIRVLRDYVASPELKELLAKRFDDDSIITDNFKRIYKKHQKNKKQICSDYDLSEEEYDELEKSI